MSADVDAAILGLEFGTMGSPPAPFKLLDSFVPVKADGKTVEYQLPYAVYFSSLGDDHSPRLTGRNTRRAVFFSITYVGISPEQCKLAGQRVRDGLVDRRLVLDDRKTWLIGLEESQRIRRDDDAINPEGKPLYYGVDNYAVSITTKPVQPELA